MSDWLAFLKNEWLWSLTWGWYQSSLGLFFSTLIFVFVRKIKSLPALVLVVTSYWSAFVVYLLLVCVSCCYFYLSNSPLHSVGGTHSPLTALALGVLFSVLQSCFLHITHHWYRIQLACVVSVTLLGNATAAVCASYITTYLAYY